MHGPCSYDCRLDLQRGVHVCVCDHCGKTIESLPEALGQQSHASEKPSHEASGPGTELSKLLKRFGIEPTPTCQCRAKASQMDAWGVDECSRPERIDEVVAVMRAEAEARGMLFLDVVGRLLVRRAIRSARRAASNAGNTVS